MKVTQFNRPRPLDPADPPRLVVGITGASGVIYGLRLVRYLLAGGATVEVIISPAGRRVMKDEVEWSGEAFAAFIAKRFGGAVSRGTLIEHNWADIGATIASGSVDTDGMVVAPCSMGTLSGIVTGRASNLIERAADVILKEQRPLVLVPRETPLNAIHVDNMKRAIDAGIGLVPAMPAFYFNPGSIDELVDFVVGRALRLLGVAHELYEPWTP